LKIKTVPIEAISFDQANVRKHGDKNIAAIKASLKRFGQQKPIIVDGNLIVRAGNGTLQAATELGWREINVVESDLGAAELTAFAIADNRTAELAEWDMGALAKQLAALDSEGFDYDTLGFEWPAAEEGTTDPKAEWKEMPEFDQKDVSAVKKLIVNFESLDDVESFASVVGQNITDKTKYIWWPEKIKNVLVDQAYVSERGDDT